MINVRLATACLAAAATFLSAIPTASTLPTREAAPVPRDYALQRRQGGASFQGLEGDELIAWAEDHRAALRSKYASKLRGSAAQEAELVAQQKRRRRRRRRANQRRDTATGVDLVNYQYDSTFYAPVTIGTPGQSVNMVLDTGSADMWTVQGKQDWNPASSSSFTNSTTDFNITYGSGAVSGTLATDNVTLAGHTAAKQTFAIATRISDGLLGAALEGIMGFGFPSLSTSGATPFWQSAGANEFSFYLEPSALTGTPSAMAPGGTFTLGGRNASLYQGDINWSTVVDESYWLITLGGITSNGQTVDLDGTNKVAVDTGTTLIGAPDAVVKQLYANVAGSQELASGYYTFPCPSSTTTQDTSSINATMHFGNQVYTLTADNLIAGTVDSSGTTCLGSFFSIGSNSNDELQYILGDAFLINVYSVFSDATGAARVGFAALADGLSTSTSSTTVSQVATANGAAGSLFRPTALLTCVVASTMAALLLMT